MSGVICAVRGGPASQPTIEKAITLAEMENIPLYFLYVVNLDFLTHTSISRVHVLSEEMRQMGEFIVMRAQSQAETRGLKSQGIVRQGNVIEEIIALCQEIKADFVVLGMPRETDAENVFTQTRIESFRNRISSEGGAELVIAEEDEPYED